MKNSHRPLRKLGFGSMPELFAGKKLFGGAQGILNIVIGVFWVMMVARLVWLQGVKGAVWQVQAESNRSVRVVQRAPRGVVLDRYDKEIATNTLQYSQLYTENDQLLERTITQEEATTIIATAPAQVRKNFVRQYPFGPVFSHVVGYIQKPKFSGDVVFGRTGLELSQNAKLAGKDGLVVYERNAQGEAQRVLWKQDPVVGEPLRLSLDAELSEVAFRALKGQRGSVIVSIPNTGEVLTLVSAPSFFPDDSENLKGKWAAEITSGMVSLDLGEALINEFRPLLFRPLTGLYPPGSVYKIVTALAGLEREVIDKTTQVRDEGELKVGDFTYQNWYWRQYGKVEGDVNVVKALARSNDIFFYKLAEWIGPQNLAEFSHWLSFGELTEIDIAGEQKGLVPDPAWKQEHFGERWYLGNTFHMGIGQGDLQVTPIQVHTMMSTVAARGRRCEPRVLQGKVASCQELAFQPSSLGLVVQGLRQACAPGGTAFPFFTTTYDVMCKTGTAEFGGENEEGHRATHGWFVTAISRNERQSMESTEFTSDLVVTVMVESDEQQPYKEGSKDAAPVAKEIVDWWLQNRK